MAIHGFSIFLGFFPMFIFALIFCTLFPFKKFREDYKVYYDALFSISMCVYMGFYYMAFNYPEKDDTGKRSLLACVFIVIFIMAFLVASLSWMTAGAFWQFIKVKSEIVETDRNSDRSDNSGKGVRFAPSVDEPERQKFLQQLNNRIIFSVVVATVCLPLLNILIDIFSTSESDTADTINGDHKCWMGGTLMYVFIFLPAAVAIVASLAFYIWSGTTIDAEDFFKSKPTNPLVRNIQLRVILVLGYGVWWLIEIPALAYHSPTAIQHLKGLLYIPLTMLAYYTFVWTTPGIYETWDRYFPLGAKIKKEVKIHWKYSVFRPIQKKINRLKAQHRHRDGGSSLASSPTDSKTPEPIQISPVIHIQPAPGRPAPAKAQDNVYDVSEESDEFKPPNTYMNNEIPITYNNATYEDDIELKPIPAPTIPSRAGWTEPGKAKYSLPELESPLYIDPAAEGESPIYEGEEQYSRKEPAV